MADHHGPGVDASPLHADQVLERELREALRSEGEIELFKVIQQGLAVRAELQQSAIVRSMLSAMWSTVADFFEAVTAAETLAGLEHNDPLVLHHQRMRANFSVVADVNQSFKKSAEAEEELVAVDDMESEIEDL
jgi:hypothetical protein